MAAATRSQEELFGVTCQDDTKAEGLERGWQCRRTSAIVTDKSMKQLPSASFPSPKRPNENSIYNRLTEY
jgi:hypothetical protein